MPRTLDPISLRYFVAICEEGSMAAAAHREAVVPSAISKRLAALEDDLALPLLLRGHKQLAPTPAGQVLLRQAREILAMIARTRAELQEFAQGVSGSVRVLASLSALSELMPDDIARFLAEHQQIRVSLEEQVSSEIVRGVRDGAADLGVLWDAGDLQGLATAPYRRDQIAVILRPDHPLASHNTLRFEQTLDHPSLGVVPGSIMARMMVRYAALAGRELVHRIQVSTIDGACRLVAAGLGLAVLPQEAVALHAGSLGLKVIPLTDAWAQRRFVIVHQPIDRLSAAARLLLGFLSQLEPVIDGGA